MMSTARCDLGRDDALVDADDAVFERLGDPPDAAPTLTLPRERPQAGEGMGGGYTV